jgi:hypothetical protein
MVESCNRRPASFPAHDDRRIAFVEVIPGIGRNLGIAIANPAASANDVTLTLRDAAGAGTNTVVTVSVRGRVDIFDTSGKPMAVNLNGTSASTFTYSLQPAATFVLAPRDANGQSPF